MYSDKYFAIGPLEQIRNMKKLKLKLRTDFLINSFKLI